MEKGGDIMRKKNQIVYKQMDLIKEIAEENPAYSIDDVRNILESFENCIKEKLAESEAEHPVQVKLFFGLSLLGWVVPASNRNCFGVDLEIDDKIRVKPKLTRYFTRKINELVK